MNAIHEQERTNRLSRLRQSIVGWIYPPVCASCDAALEAKRQMVRPFLCENCEAALIPVGDVYCRVCGQGYAGTSPLSFHCSNCSDRVLAIDFAVSAYRGAGVGSHLIHKLKYGRSRHLARTLGSLLDVVWRDERLRSGAPWWVVPVPLHARRKRQRGFNQSHELARQLVLRAPSGISMELRPLLRRVRQGVNQARLDRQSRLVNLAGAYVPIYGAATKLPEGANILLVDDVITTCATVSECATVLREAVPVNLIAAVSVLRG